MLKKSIYLIVLFLAVSSLLHSQTPQYYNYNTTNNGNTFPLGTAGGRMVQWLILPGNLNLPNQAGSGNITTFYGMAAATFGPLTYTNFRIMFGLATITSLPTSAFYTGPMDTVFFRASTSLTGTLGSWFSMALDHPFYYDSTKSLIIQVEQQSASGAALYSWGTTYLTGKRRTYSTVYPFGVQGQDAYVYNFGVDISPATGTGNPGIVNTPKEYKLCQNYPNPFNPFTRIGYEIPKNSFVKLSVFDALGREVSVLVNGFVNAGLHEAEFNAENISSGVYFYRLETGSFTSTKQMVILK